MGRIPFKKQFKGAVSTAGVINSLIIAIRVTELGKRVVTS